MSGLFITFEGTEGCGKSTQIKELRDHLESLGRKVLVTREPGGAAISEAIRTILLDTAHHAMTPTTELFLYEAARAQHVAEVIRPALKRGECVLCDRYADSTTAYQGGGRELPVDVLERLHEIATGGLWPRITFLLDLPVEEGLQRAGDGGRYDRIEQETVEFHVRVRDAFIALAEEHPDRIRIVDARGSVQDVAAQVRAFTDEVLAAL